MQIVIVIKTGLFMQNPITTKYYGTSMILSDIDFKSSQAVGLPKF